MVDFGTAGFYHRFLAAGLPLNAVVSASGYETSSVVNPGFIAIYFSGVLVVSYLEHHGKVGHCSNATREHITVPVSPGSPHCQRLTSKGRIYIYTHASSKYRVVPPSGFNSTNETLEALTCKKGRLCTT